MAAPPYGFRAHDRRSLSARQSREPAHRARELRGLHVVGKAAKAASARPSCANPAAAFGVRRDQESVRKRCLRGPKPERVPPDRSADICASQAGRGHPPSLRSAASATRRGNLPATDSNAQSSRRSLAFPEQESTGLHPYHVIGKGWHVSGRDGGCTAASTINLKLRCQVIGLSERSCCAAAIRGWNAGSLPP